MTSADKIASDASSSLAAETTNGISSSTTTTTATTTTSKKKLPFGHVLTPQVSEALKTYQNVTFEQQYGTILPAPIPSPTPSFEWKDMVIESVLGQGSFSFVFQVTVASSSMDLGDGDTDQDENDPPRKMALKCLKASSVETSEDLVYNAMDLYSEANLLERLQSSSSSSSSSSSQSKPPHPHIIQLLGTCRTPLASSFARDDGYFVLLEVIQDTLQERLDSWRSMIDNDDEVLLFERMISKHAVRQRLQDIALPVADAMRYLHDHQIVVRDLKPENVGFDNVTGKIKLFDFGLARSVELLKNETSIAGSILYMAPEVLQIHNNTIVNGGGGGSNRNPTSPGVAIGTASDVYSFAILTWELCTLEVPLRKCTTLEEVVTHVGKRKKRPNLAGVPSSKMKTFLQRLWKQDPKDRPTFEQIVPMMQKSIVVGSGNSGNSGSFVGVADSTNNNNNNEEYNNNNNNNNNHIKAPKKRSLSKFFSR